MERYFRSSSRGASVLGALIIALMLGSGAVGTYEYVNNDSSISGIEDESQLASLHTAADRKKAAEEISKKKLEDEINTACKKLQGDLAGKPLGTYAPAKTVPTPLKLGGSGTEDSVTVEGAKCVSAFVGGSKEKPEVQCFGMESKIIWSKDKKEIVSSPSQNAKIKGKCIVTKLTGPDGKTPLKPEE